MFERPRVFLGKQTFRKSKQQKERKKKKEIRSELIGQEMQIQGHLTFPF